MKLPRKFLRIGLPVIAFIAILTLLANFLFIEFVVNVLWYNSLGYLRLFFFKLGYKYLVFVAVTALFFLLVFLNFWVASRYVGVTLHHKEDKFRRLVKTFRSMSIRVYTPISLVLAILLALPVYREWENALLFFWAPATGNADALFGLDVSFYLFALPIINLLYGRFLLALAVLLLALAVLYAAELKVLSENDQPLYKGAKIHLSLVILLMFLVQAVGYGLEALMLQYTTKNMDLFFGPGYAEIYWTLPLLGVAAFMMIPLAASLIRLVFLHRGIKTCVFFAILALCAHGVRNQQAIPNSVNNFIVKPNELEKQGPFIAQTIQSTLTAYQLQDVERRTFEKAQADRPIAMPGGATQFDNIPLWDYELLADVFQQLQAIRPYYQFTGVDAARYMFGDELHQVYLAAREITTDRLPEGAQNWINKRMKYTHGYGAVMIPAAQSGEQRMRWYLQNMPPESDVGFELKNPSIYYGLSDLQYVIAPNKSHEFHYPGEDDVKSLDVDYEGTGGVNIGNFLRKTFFAYYFRDRNLFFTGQTHSGSRIHFRRNIMERIAILTPFLQLDENPYLVVTPDRLYWIVDAYTTSRWYPNSETFHQELNYIRNSVKIVVDAYDGSVDYYLAEPDDPIARAYQRMYPGLIKDLGEMPGSLQAQVRYPKDLFEIQMRMYTKYHQEDPETYYQSEDLMQFAEVPHQDTLITMRPYYVTLDLIEPGKRDFLLLTPLLPVNRDNLRALAVVGSDKENYGRKIIYDFPRGSQVYGPPQVNALIDQNTDIAQSITLWNQQGSEVVRGKMIILPIDGRVIYIQPLYMEATGRLRIPQLKRVIVYTDETVVMDLSVESAMRRLHEIFSAEDTPAFIDANNPDEPRDADL
ncbi:MAG: UPF0182 family protein [Kiritimatiellia bacterium]